MQNKALPPGFAFIGEVGLSGEIRPARKVSQKIAEAKKFGIQTLFISKYTKEINNTLGINVITISRIEQLMELFD